MPSILFASAIAVAAFATQLSAHEIISGSIEVIHPTIALPFAGAKSAAGYMAISNEGDAIDRLLGVESDIASKITIHRTEFRDDVAHMIPVPALDIRAQDIVILEPGGVHMMFMGLSGTLDESQMIYVVVGDAETQLCRMAELGYGEPVALNIYGRR